MTTASLDTYFEKQKSIAHFENLEEFLNDEDMRIRSLAIKATNKLNKILKLHPAIVDVFNNTEFGKFSFDLGKRDTECQLIAPTHAQVYGHQLILASTVQYYTDGYTFFLQSDVFNTNKITQEHIDMFEKLNADYRLRDGYIQLRITKLSLEELFEFVNWFYDSLQ